MFGPFRESGSGQPDRTESDNIPELKTGSVSEIPPVPVTDSLANDQFLKGDWFDLKSETVENC